MFSIERPYIFWGILWIIPLCLLVWLKFRKMKKSLGGLLGSSYTATTIAHLNHAIFIRTFLRVLSWVCVLLAAAGISWGSRNVPVQKSGCAVCLLFDISYSMTAEDEKGGISRLDAVKQYSQALLDNMYGTSVSVVLAKGDGFVAIPLTEDFTAVRTLIDSLSPELMSSAGTSLGRGIDAALTSFPKLSAQSDFIWVFTDGDETDDKLLPALNSCLEYGIPVTIIGFGSEDGVNITAGDGKTSVTTFLMANRMKNYVSDANEKSSVFKHGLNARKYIAEASFITAAETGSAQKLFEQINFSRETDSFSYEIQPIKRHKLFIFFALIFLALSFIFGELNLENIKHLFDKGNTLLVSLAVCTLFASCHSERKDVLDGVWAYYNHNLKSATSQFLTVSSRSENNTDAQYYALFGLATTYISLEQYDEALKKLEAIPSDASDSLLSASFYNMGIIYELQNDFESALVCFKKAVLKNPKNQNAKVNVEFCNRQLAIEVAPNRERELQGAAESKDENPLEKEIFNMIRENDKNIWKKMESDEHENDTLDY